MATQCLVITIIILAIAFSFYKIKRKDWAASTFPFILIPLANMTVSYIYRFILKVDYDFFVMLIVIISAVLLSGIWVFACIKKFIIVRKYKISYLIISSVFNVVLSLILLNHYAAG